MSVYFFVTTVLFLMYGAQCAPLVKRSDDATPLENVVNLLSSRLQQLEAKFSALSSNIDILNVKAAFMTSMHGDVTVANDVIVKFDTVQYNEGNSYDPITGIFTAPVSGLYSLFLKTETTPNHSAGLMVKKEGGQVLYIYATDHDSYQTPSGEVVLHMDKGQRVWVQTTRTSNELRAWTRFGGFLVHADTNV